MFKKIRYVVLVVAAFTLALVLTTMHSINFDVFTGESGSGYAAGIALSIGEVLAMGLMMIVLFCVIIYWQNSK